MVRAPTTSYFFYRIVIPGAWTALLLYMYGRILWPHELTRALSGIALTSVIAVASIVLGVLLHYGLNYPRRRRRFREIEKECGPIDYVMSLCPNGVGFRAATHFYFSLLHEEIPKGTRERVYYFSSVYLMLTHCAFAGVLVGILGTLAHNLLVWFGSSDPSYGLLGLSVGLALVAWAIDNNHIDAEKYLVLMFEMQKEWVRTHRQLVLQKMHEAFNSQIAAG